jgi:CRP-like cAMP-binding protein
MTAPTYFGEIGVLDGITPTAAVIAAGPCRCLRIDGDLLLQALATTPPSSGLIENASRRLALTHPTRRMTFTPVSEPAD